jgi:aryl-alcohol dehydrogenase-like predicted oxidoreductase
MTKRKLGNSGLEIAPLVFGGNVFGWTLDEAASFRLLDAYVDAGFDAIDTADVYSRWVPGHRGGESETIIGKWLQKSNKRDKVTIFTKVGMDMGDGRKGLKKDYIIQSAQDSLKRLGTDRIDLYQSHEEDTSTPVEETLEAYSHLIKHGLVRVSGASNYTGKRLRQAVESAHRTTLPAYQSLQPLYNLYDRFPFEIEHEPVCREFGLGVIPYYSLASGFLTGKYRSEKDAEGRARGAGVVRKYLNDRGFRILKALDEISEEVRASQASVSLAWLLARPSVTAPIVSATSVDQLQDLIKATQLTLTPPMIAKLEAASA